MKIQAIRHLAVLTCASAALSGCAGTNLGALGDILGGAIGGMGGQQQQGQLLVEVQGVDTRNQVIQVRTDQGQNGNLRYDGNTVVTYQQQQYPVTALERGDVAQIQVQQVGQNELYASRIDVTQSVQERNGQTTGGTAGLQQLTGQVSQVDYTNGLFQLQMQNGTVTVGLPYNAPSGTVDRFRNLRRGDYVRLEGTWLGNGRVELYRFL